MVYDAITDRLKEEIYLTISEKLNEKKYNVSEINCLTQMYHDGIKTGVDEVDNVRILVFYDMR